MESSVRSARSQSDLTSDTGLLVLPFQVAAEPFLALPPRHVSRRRAGPPPSTLFVKEHGADYAPLNRLVAGAELAAHPVSEPVSAAGSGTGIFDAETERPLAIFLGPETGAETRRRVETPHFARQIDGCATEFDPYELGGGRCMARTGCPPRSLSNQSHQRFCRGREGPRIFLSRRSFRFTVDVFGFVWSHPNITNGLSVATLSITGVVIWWRKRRAQLAPVRKHPR
jgi:hypothetical protein